MATINALSNASNPFATTALTVDPGASGDSYVQFNINAANKFRVGVDDDAADAFKIASGVALGTTDAFIMTAVGERTMPLQPAFSAKPSGALLNVTGDGTTYPIVFATESFDQNNDFDGTSTFTAPVTGMYYFYANIQVDDITTNYTDFKAQFNVNSGTIYPWIQIDPSIGIGNVTVNGSLFIKLTATNTVTVELIVTGDTKTVDVLTANNATFFSGRLVC